MLGYAMILCKTNNSYKYENISLNFSVGGDIKGNPLINSR